VSVLCNREALGLNRTENTCCLERYFDGFVHTFYIIAAYSTVRIYFFPSVCATIHSNRRIITAERMALHC